MTKFQFIMLFIWIAMILIITILSMNFFHPVILMIFIIMFSIFINLNMSLWKSNFIYSIILFLIMISGLLIIFLYFASLISNEQIMFPSNKIFMFLFIINSLLFMHFFNKNKLFFNNYFTFNVKEINPIMKINEKSFQNIIFIYEYPFNNFTISCMFYLLISLFTIIKICSFKSLSLRKIK